MYTVCRLTGYSPFQGETHSDTFCNVSMCEYDFEDEVFDEVSQEAKDFIEELLQKKPRYMYMYGYSPYISFICLFDMSSACVYQALLLCTIGQI